MAFVVINIEPEQAIWENIGALVVPTPAGAVSTANINGTLTLDGGGISVNDFSNIIQIQYVNTFADLQTALTNLSGFGGGKVIIAEGTYTATATLTIPDNVIVEGSGIGATILQADVNLNAPIFIINGGTNVIIQNLSVDGNAANQSGAFNVVDITGLSSRVIINNCNLSSSFDNGSYLIGISAGSMNIFVQGCLLTQNVAPASAGSGINCIGEGCYIAGNTFTSNFEPINVSGSNNIIKGNIITTFGNPLNVATGATEITIEANTLENQVVPSSPMMFINTATTRIQIFNNILRTSAGSGILITGTATEVLIEGNSITDTTDEAFDLTGLSSEFVAITKNNAQEDLTDPATINGAADRVLVETTTPTSVVLGDLTTDCAGHTIYIELDVDGGDLTLTATSANGFGSITFDDAGDWAILEWTGNAWLIKSSQGVVIDTTTIQPRQQIEYSLSDLNYDGTTIQDFPDNSVLTLTTGNHLVNYSVSFTTSDTSNVVSTFFRDADTNAIIDESKTIFNDSVNVGRHNISKQFIHNVATSSQRLKLSYLLSAGTATTPAVQLSLPEGVDMPTFNQAPVITSNFLDALTVQENSYSGADINYNGTSVVNVPSTITLTNGTWLFGYSLALRTPSTGDSVSVFIEDAGSNVISQSKTFITESTSTSRHVVSKYFLYTEAAGPTTYRIGFRTDTLADVSPAVEINTIGGSLVVPNQVVNIWAVDISGLTNTQDTYTTLTDINYNNANYVDVPINITLSSTGDYLLGYSLALRCPQIDIDPVLITLRNDITNEVFALGKTFITDNSTDTRHTITKSFLYRKTTSTSETFKLSFSLQNINDTSVALEMTPFTGITDPDQVPVLWAVRLGDVPTNLGTSFLDLIDTPNTYNGFSGKAVVVNPAETGLTYGDFYGSTIIDTSNITTSIISFPAGFPATITISNSTTMRIGSVQVFSATFILNTATTPTDPLDLTYVFEFDVPDAPTFTSPNDAQIIANGYAYSNLGSLLTTNFVINNLITFVNPFSNNIRCSYNHTGGTSGIIHAISVNIKYTTSI